MIDSKQIASFLGLKLNGENIPIKDFSQLSDLRPGVVVFAKRYDEKHVAALNSHDDIVAIVANDYSAKLHCPHIVSANPRLDFIRTLNRFFAPPPAEGRIHPTAVVEEGARLGRNVSIGPHCYISARCTIGYETILHANVVLDNDVRVGARCEIKSGAVIGQSGFGFERDADGTPLLFPHKGGVVLGDDVYIGANTCIDRGTLGNTVIERNAKIDNLVHIAHNCHIGEGAFVIAGATLGGGTRVGRGCWLAPNVTVKEQTVVHDNALIGLGAVVLKEVETGAVMVGNPAKKLEKKDKK